jgi:hypothetical protein
VKVVRPEKADAVINSIPITPMDASKLHAVLNLFECSYVVLSLQRAGYTIHGGKE